MAQRSTGPAWKTALAALAFALALGFAGCELGRTEARAPGKPTMNELMHRRVDGSREMNKKAASPLERARTLTPDEARQLLAKLQTTPQDAETFWTLVRYYEHTVNIKDLNALRLSYIARYPGGEIHPGNINPKFDRASYDQGKKLWLAHLQRPGASPEIYQRAARFLEGGDKPLAESALEAGRKAHPNDTQWPTAFGQHYAQALLGATEPLTEYNVFRTSSEEEAASPYAASVRAKLRDSNDVNVLAQTAQYLLVWCRPPCSGQSGPGTLQLARTYLEKALAIQPDSANARGMKAHLEQRELGLRTQELLRLSPAEVAGLNATDRMMLMLAQMRQSWVRQKPKEAAAQAQELLTLAAKNQSDRVYGDAVFEGNIILGKAALRDGRKRDAARHLLAAAETPGSESIRRGMFEMNLPRALVDWGERTTAARFLETMAPKTRRSKEFEAWAADIRKGINPDLIPTFSPAGCSHDPC